MEIIQIVALGLVASILIVLVRKQRPEIAVLLSIAVGAILFGLVVDKIGAVVTVIRDLSVRANINNLYIGTVLKIMGIAYLADFGAQVCRDAGEGAVAAKIELAAKVLILILAVPIVIAVLESLLRLIP